MLNDIMKDESPTLIYCMILISRDFDAFTQFIDILIETKRNIIMGLILNTTLEIQ